MMQTYLVGGAVRDAMMGLPLQDRDWVVVGATPQQLLDQGFLPVGRDFPVFLHPSTKEEYALARTERKTAPGYRGFAVHAAPGVTLEEDLARRDLTINALAVDAELLKSRDRITADMVHDPFGGLRDLQQRVLRHVTPAFREDPVRILRVARFCARFTDFEVAPETLVLMQQIVQLGEADHLVPERVWQELAKGLMEAQPSRMFTVLGQCGALTRLMPGLQDQGAHLRALDAAAAQSAPLAVRFACLTDGQSPQSWTLLRVYADCLALATLLAREREALAQAPTGSAQALLELLERCDAIRKPERFAQLLQAFTCVSAASPHALDVAKLLSEALACVQSVATNSIAAHAMSTGANGPKVGKAIHEARTVAVRKYLNLR